MFEWPFLSSDSSLNDLLHDFNVKQLIIESVKTLRNLFDVCFQNAPVRGMNDLLDDDEW